MSRLAPVGSRWAAGGLAAAAGGAWALAAPPRGWWPLLPLGVGVFAVALAGRDLRQRLLLGAVTGAVLYGTTLRWLTDFSLPGYVLMAVLETALLAAAAALAARWWSLIHSQPDGPFVLAAPLGGALLVLPDGEVVAQTELGAAELLRAQVPLQTGLTPFARTGELPVFTLAVGISLLPVVLAQRQTRRPPVPHGRRLRASPPA